MMKESKKVWNHLTVKILNRSSSRYKWEGLVEELVYMISLNHLIMTILFKINF